ncbi:hypothetical protein Tco_0557493, partial [Tanacetum coccineum]
MEKVKCRQSYLYVKVEMNDDTSRGPSALQGVRIKTLTSISKYVDQGCQDRDLTWDRFCLCKIEI